MSRSEQQPLQVYTIGHSNHEPEHFIELLRRHGIEVVADVRSQPFAKYTTHFNAGEIDRHLAAAGIRYVFLGKELGGRPDGPQFYDAEGHVLYDRLAASRLFRRGIERLEHGISQYRVAIMCGEEDPAECHRNLLVGRILAEHGVEVLHIRGDGRLQTQAELDRAARGDSPGQLYLFEEPDEPKERQWRSTRSVLHKPPQQSSSES